MIVYVVIGPAGDVEVLDSPPLWDWQTARQTVVSGNVNGGDTVTCVMHAPTCPITTARAELAHLIRTDPVMRDVWRGAQIENYGGGDQEVENCECGAAFGAGAEDETAAQHALQDMGVLAHALLELPADADSDYLAVVDALRPHVSDSVFQSLCDALEVCPVHVCDEAICRDDQDQTCPIGRAA